MSHALVTSLGFLLALALGAAVVAALGAAGVGEPWPIVAGWVVFLAGGTLIGRRLQHRGRRLQRRGRPPHQPRR